MVGKDYVGFRHNKSLKHGKLWVSLAEGGRERGEKAESLVYNVCTQFSETIILIPNYTICDLSTFNRQYLALNKKGLIYYDVHLQCIKKDIMVAEKLGVAEKKRGSNRGLHRNPKSGR